MAMQKPLAARCPAAAAPPGLTNKGGTHESALWLAGSIYPPIPWHGTNLG
jgi:hypothetical protein